MNDSPAVEWTSNN